MKFIDYTELLSWDVKQYRINDSHFNKRYPLVLFGTFLKKATIERVKIKNDDIYKILGVRSYGKGVYVNREVKGNSLKMREYYKAKANHLFWCKVDTKNGAFGVIKDDLANGYGSSNMTFAEIDTTKIDVNYMQLLFSSKGVISYLDNFVTGTTNRKYIRPDQLLNEIKIPLPSLEEQEKIINNYHTKMQEVAQLEDETKNLMKEIELYFLEQIGLQPSETKKRSKGLNFVEFMDILGWGTDKIMSKSKFDSKVHELVSIADYNLAITNVFRGKTPKYAIKSNKYILNQKCNRWNKIEMEFAKPVVEEWYNSIDEKFFTREGDIIINSTGEGTIGRLSYITKNFEGLIYDSHILLLRLNGAIVNPELFVELFNNSFGQAQIEEIKSAQATKQTELGINNLLKIKIPVIPDLKTQQVIVDKVKGLRSTIKLKSEQAIILKQQAEQTFEETIFN